LRIEYRSSRCNEREVVLFFIIPQVQTQPNWICDVHVIVLFLMLSGYSYSRIFYFLQICFLCISSSLGIRYISILNGKTAFLQGKCITNICFTISFLFDKTKWERKFCQWFLVLWICCCTEISITQYLPRLFR
jgi:hypothetical protein